MVNFRTHRIFGKVLLEPLARIFCIAECTSYMSKIVGFATKKSFFELRCCVGQILAFGIIIERG